ncbi:MAG: trypsin-like peptidase domain-containing protein [Tolypothrix carrinoi HA7290-LM1]|jgi:tetratricopeptide (TPR) repeat protein|nr:trypsin-like peptidase domain-containing protein [Tolypothrix carrinoi HA7290-LM1]
MKYYYALSPILIGASIVLVSQAALAISAQDLEKIGREITVRIVDSQNPGNSGSGVIIKRAGNSYTVLTAYHVVKDAKQYQIFSPDKQSYAINIAKRLQDVDLAVVEFSSNKSYSAAKIGNSDRVTRTTTVYVAGFPAKTSAITNPEYSFIKGQVSANASPQRDGYNLAYSVPTSSGMSGGPVLNEQGDVVGVHGRGVSDRSETNQQQLVIAGGLGTDINTALRQIASIGIDIGVRAPSTIATAPKEDDLFIKANQKYLNRDYVGAINDLTEAIRLNPNYAEAYAARGNIRAQLYDKRKAIADYTEAIRLNPNYAPAYLYRGNQRFSEDEEGALADFQQFQKLDAESAQKEGLKIVKQIAGIIKYIDNISESYLKQTRAATVLAPNSDEVWSMLGILYLKNKQYDNAIAALDRAKSLNRKNGDVLFALASVYLQQQNDKAAAESLEAGLKFKPNEAGALFSLGVVYHRQGKLSEAITQYQKASAQNATSSQISLNSLNNIGLIKYEQGNIAGAMRQWQAVVETNRYLPNPESQFALAVALYSQGDRQQSQKLAEAAIRRDRRYENVEFLKQNLWGDRLLADTRKFLEYLEKR